MARTTKKDIYASYGIKFDGNGHIYHDVLGWIPLLLVNGNEKIGKGVYHFSTLPTNKSFTVTLHTLQGDITFTIDGTCPCTCPGCYATKGNYNYDSTIESLALKTRLVYNDLGFVKRAILAQIAADKIKFVRIHASGDFFSLDYIVMWKEIVAETKETIYWTYTKNAVAESAFDAFDNANIVKSIIPGHGLNYGHCDYIIDTYNALKEAGKKVYICRCGIDKNQHCNDCKGCSVNDYVLFIEHSTEYKAEKDIFFEAVKAIIESQKRPE